jgi:hypothetical protein
MSGGIGSRLTLVGEVLLSELVLFNLEASLEKFLSLIAADGDRHCNFLISLDTEGSDCVSGLGLDGLLVSEILEHLGCLGESITALSDAAVDDELLNLDLAHWVGLLGLELRVQRIDIDTTSE